MSASRRRAFLAAALAALAFPACMGDDRPHVVFEFGAAPEDFEGMDVEIDGKVVGKLKKTGSATRTGFPLDKGKHVIRLISDRFDCDAVHVNAELKLQKVYLLVNFSEMPSTSGKPRISLQR